jgi:putative transposase
VATVSSGTTSERFGFVQRFRSELGAVFLCKWLNVSTSGFYAWLKRKESSRSISDKLLKSIIKRIYKINKGRYGSPRIYKVLKAQGHCIGRKRVKRLMRESGLVARVTRMTRRAPGLKRFKARGENRLLEHGNAKNINQVWVADATYLKVKGEWQYLATVMDQYSRRILGWSLSSTRTTKLTTDALKYALKKRGYPRGLIFHTDRGIEFTGHVFQALLNKYDFKHSLNRPGHCTDNAFMESFYHSLKGELIRGVVYKCIADLRSALSTYINQFYNAVRLHSGLNYLSPIEYERSLV